MTKADFLKDQKANAKFMLCKDIFSVGCKRLVNFVEQKNIPDDARLLVIDSSDFKYMSRKNRLDNCYDYERIIANSIEGRPWTYVIAVEDAEGLCSELKTC